MNKAKMKPNEQCGFGQIWKSKACDQKSVQIMSRVLSESGKNVTWQPDNLAIRQPGNLSGVPRWQSLHFPHFGQFDREQARLKNWAPVEKLSDQTLPVQHSH